MTTYRKEATTRVLYLTGAAIISLIIAIIVAAIVLSFFPHSSRNVRNSIFFYTVLATFAIVCSVLVYRVDQKMNKRFNQNP